MSWHPVSGSAVHFSNVILRKLLSAHKSHVRETSLFTGAIPNPVCNSKTSFPFPQLSRPSFVLRFTFQQGLVRLLLLWADRSKNKIGLPFVFHNYLQLQSALLCGRDPSPPLALIWEALKQT